MGDSRENVLFNDGECDKTFQNLYMTIPVNTPCQPCIAKETQNDEVGNNSNRRKRRREVTNNLPPDVSKKSPRNEGIRDDTSKVNSEFRKALIVGCNVIKEARSIDNDSTERVSSIINTPANFCREKVWLPITELDSTDGGDLGLTEKPGDIMIKTNAHVNNVLIELDTGFVCCCDGRIEVKPIRQEDAAFRLQMLTYDYQAMGNDGQWHTENKLRARIVRHIDSDRHCRFLYISDNGTLLFKEKPVCMCSTPSVNDLNNETCFGEFQLKSSVLLSYNVAEKGPEQLILGCLSKRDYYILGNSAKETLDLTHEDLSLMYKPNATFKIHNLDS